MGINRILLELGKLKSQPQMTKQCFHDDLRSDHSRAPDILDPLI